MPDFDERERDVLSLLRDMSVFVAPFGSAMPLDEQRMADTAYGPAGYVRAGKAHEDKDIAGLARSIPKLILALRMLRHDDFDAWASLIGPYLGDPADPGSVEDMRRKVGDLDEHNAKVRRENDRRRKKGKSPLHEKTGLVIARQQLERHDRAIEGLANYLRNVKLEPAHGRLMSTREEQAGERANSQLNATVDRLMATGLREDKAVKQAGQMFGVSADEVLRVREFRSVLAPALCEMEGCEVEAFAKGLCQAHYRQQWREKRRAG